MVALGGLYPLPGGLSRARRDLLTSPGNSVVAEFPGLFFVLGRGGVPVSSVVRAPLSYIMVDDE